MIRAGHLYDDIADTDNLLMAFCRARRGKSLKPEVKAFSADLAQNIASIRNELLNGPLDFGHYHYFTIYEPKERLISALSFRERVLQHAIINVCSPYFEKFQIFDSYACRCGKGIDPCLARAQCYCRRYTWFMKLDVHKFFDSIDHRILISLLAKRFKDERLMQLLWEIIDSYEVTAGVGIPIGNLTSQYFANFYLAWLDHQIKERWHAQGYVRYMDDFLIFGNSKEAIISLYHRIEEYLRSMLAIELNPVILNRTAKGIPFLSYIVLGSKLRLSLKAKRRFRKQIAIANAEECAELALPLLAFVQRADSAGFRRGLLHS